MNKISQIIDLNYQNSMTVLSQSTRQTAFLIKEIFSDLDVPMEDLQYIVTNGPITEHDSLISTLLTVSSKARKIKH